MDKKLTSSLKKNFDFFLKEKENLLKEFHGRFLVICDQSIKGDFGTEKEAYQFAKENFESGDFLIQQCTPESDTLQQTFHSRAVFVNAS